MSDDKNTVENVSNAAAVQQGIDPYKVRGFNTEDASGSDNPTGVLGRANGSGQTYGVQGVTDSVGAFGDDVLPAGVRGEATDTGDVIGVEGVTQGEGAYAAGVKAEANAQFADALRAENPLGTAITADSNATSPSILARKSSSGGNVISGVSTVTTAPAAPAGVNGRIEGAIDNAKALYGEARADSGATYGVYGYNLSNEGTGVYGEMNRQTAAASDTRGVHGVNDNSGDVNADIAAVGVEGESTSSGLTYGVRGTVDSEGEGSAGVVGRDGGGTGPTYGVLGETKSTNTDAAGVAGLAPNGQADGVLGDARGSNGNGVRAFAETSSYYGVYATHTGTDSQGGHAIVGQNSVTDEAAIEAQGNGFRNSDGIGLNCWGDLDVSGQMSITDRVAGSEASPNTYLLDIQNDANSSQSENAMGIAVSFPNQSTAPGPAQNFVAFRSGGTACGSIEGNGSGGATFETSGADYAEYLPRKDTAEALDAGDVVGVHGGEISRQTEDAAQVLVVTDRPAVTGNAPPEDADLEAYETVSFTGQVPVRVRGPVEDGDLLVASGEADGTAVAVTPEQWDGDRAIVGRAWTDDDGEDVRRVTAAIGIDDATAVGAAIEARDERIDDLEAKLGERDDRMAALEAENERLHDRLDAIEARLDAPAGAAPADD